MSFGVLNIVTLRTMDQQVLTEFGVVPMNMIDQNVIDYHGSGPEM
jgi:hypothetical protein